MEEGNVPVFPLDKRIFKWHTRRTHFDYYLFLWKGWRNEDILFALKPDSTPSVVKDGSAPESLKGSREAAMKYAVFLTFRNIALRCSCQQRAAASHVPLPFPSFAERGQLCFLITIFLPAGHLDSVLAYPNSIFSLLRKWHGGQIGQPMVRSIFSLAPVTQP